MIRLNFLKRIEWLKRMQRSDRLIYMAVLAVLFVMIGMIVGFFYCVYYGDIWHGMTFGTILTYGFLRWTGLLFAFLLTLLAAIIIFMTFSRNALANMVETEGRNGERMLEDLTLGTNTYMDPEEAAERFDVFEDINNNFGFIFGMLDTETTSSVVSISWAEMSQNKAVLLLGPPGVGKSACIIRPEILQCLRSNRSFVVNDPKGELYADLSSICREQGYETKVLNLKKLEYSDTWNPLWEIFDHEKEVMDPTRLGDFAEVYIDNVNEIRADKSKDFWVEGAKGIMQANIGIHFYKWEKYMKSALLKLIETMYSEYGRLDDYYSIDEKLRDITSEKCTVRCLKDMLRDAGKRFGWNPDDIENIIDTVEAEAPEISLAEVYKDILAMTGEQEGLKELREFVKTIPEEHPSWILFRAWDMAGLQDSVKTSTLQTLAQSMQIFSNIQMRRLLCHNSINLWEISSKPCAYFVIADNTQNIKSVLSLFFYFMFDDIKTKWDEVETACKEEGTDPLTVLRPVSVIMDEFYSVGFIPQFPDFLSKARSRHIDVTIALQTLSQLSIYGEEGSELITGNCEYVVFMGGNDRTTIEWISEFQGGTTTVAKQSRRMNTGVIAGSFVKEVTYSETEVPLISVSEAKSFGNGDRRLLVIKRGCRPLELTTFYYKKHPLTRRQRFVNIVKEYRPLSEIYDEDNDAFRQHRLTKDEEARKDDIIISKFVDALKDIIPAAGSYEDLDSYEDIDSYEDLCVCEDAENWDDMAEIRPDVQSDMKAPVNEPAQPDEPKEEEPQDMPEPDAAPKEAEKTEENPEQENTQERAKTINAVDFSGVRYRRVRGKYDQEHIDKILKKSEEQDSELDV